MTFATSWLKFIFIVFLLLSAGEVRGQSLLKNLETLEKNSDDLGIRIMIRKFFKKKLTVKEWFEIRKILVRRPKIGFDAIAAWDRQLSLKATVLEKESETVFKFLEKADDFSLNREFEKSFEMYQRAAKYLRTSNKGRIPKGNQQIYLNILHQMARTLYAQKRFKESMEVYTWIPPVYPQIRQVLFEKMWASFRAGKYDMALGAIASQQSGFFSEYLHPESYLLKIYIFKRLCRKKDLAFTIDAIKNYLASLKSGKFDFLEWAKSDLYYMSLAQLLESEKNNSKAQLQLVSQKERDDEIKKVAESLKIRFKSYKPSLQAQLERVYGYASLALSNDQEFLKPLSDLPEAKVLEKKGFELWPAGDAEEWLDEIGSHVYIGSSECKMDIVPKETTTQ
jgi:hypothetical protein